MLLVPILFGLLIACGLFIKLEQNWQAGILVGAILWGVAIVFIAEGLGILGQFSRNFVLCAWIILDIVLAIIWLYRINKTKNLFNFSQLRLPSELGLISRLLLGLIFFIALLTSITALVAPPNNWDSMTYHMSRVMHWLHNSRLDHYPTHYTPQLYHPPWAEMAIAHLQVLTGGDHWANFVQWLSMIGSIIGVSAIARELGASRRGQLFATVFAISLPMGLLQSVTTQNDYAVCFWLVCLAYFVLRINNNKLTLPLTLKVSASLGLALLTKTSAYIFSLPFLAWLAVRVIYQMGWQSWQTGFILIISVLLINAGHWFRNWEVFGSPITGGPKELAVQYRMEDPNIATLLSNMVRNAAIHLSTPSRWLNAKLNGAIISFHKLIGIASNSPQTTIPGGKFGIFQVSFKEDLTGNTFHFLTILATIGAFFTISRLRRIRTAWLYLLCIVGGYIIFSWMLKWQPFNSRHHLILFVLISPFVGWVLSELPGKKSIDSFLLIIVIASFPWIYNADFRPWLGEKSIFTVPRLEQYFVQRSWLQSPYLNAAKFLQTKSCDEIGFYFEDDPGGRIWEYPFWVLLHNTTGKSKNIRHLRADNVSQVKLQQESYKNYHPCAVITVEQKNNQQNPLGGINEQDEANKKLEILQHAYRLAWQETPVKIYLADD